MTLPSGRELVQVMHGCRQLVSWDVGLSPETSATLVTSCQRIMPGTLVRLLVNSRRKAGMTSSHHVPYAQGDTHATMGGTKGCNTARWSQSQKAFPSSDCGLQLDHMKPESLVIVGQPYYGEYVLGGLYTPPVTPTEWGVPEVALLRAPKVTFARGVKS